MRVKTPSRSSRSAKGSDCVQIALGLKKRSPIAEAAC